uniref:Serpentine receptor class gamma n=1 Tax=Globodera rostochiensis TaxID=31243 RepID=A0A914HTP1_GLORO
MTDFVEWSISVQIPIIYLSICITIPSTALYIAEIVTIVRHKKFNNSFYALFVMRAIPDLLFVLNFFYGQRLPSIIGAVLYPIYSKFPNWMLAMFFFFGGHTFQANYLVTAFMLLNRLTAIIMPLNHEKDPNSTTDHSFLVYEAGDAPIINYLAYICAVFSVIFMVLCILLNICTFVAYKLHMKKVATNGNNNSDDIEKKLLFYALATFLGHALVASMFLINIITKLDDWKTKAMIFVFYTLILDTGTVVLSSWLLLWANGTFRQQLIKDFAIIRIRNIRVGAMEGPQNNNHRPVGGAVGHQLHNRFFSSVQQFPTIY